MDERVVVVELKLDANSFMEKKVNYVTFKKKHVVDIGLLHEGLMNDI